MTLSHDQGLSHPLVYDVSYDQSLGPVLVYDVSHDQALGHVLAHEERNYKMLMTVDIFCPVSTGLGLDIH